MIRDEAFYLPMMIQSVIDYVDLFILDTGSSDDTLPIIRSFQDKYLGKIVVHREEFGSNDFRDGEFRFAHGFREKDARNFALNKAIEIFDPEWIICLDGDEVVNERFWEVLENCRGNALLHSTSLPVNPYKVSNHPLDMHERNGIKLFDPHVRAWRPELNARWVQRDENWNIHMNLQWEKQPDIAICQDHIHFHLHYSFGPKSLYSYLCPTEQTAQGAAEILNMPVKEMFNQEYFEQHFQEWFEKGRFIPRQIENNLLWNKLSRFAIPMNHQLPEFVIEKWRQWGEWV